jgi:hypothetical protein
MILILMIPLKRLGVHILVVLTFLNITILITSQSIQNIMNKSHYAGLKL